MKSLSALKITAFIAPALAPFLLLSGLLFPTIEVLAERPPPPCAPCIEKSGPDGCVSSGKQYCGTICYDPATEHCKMCNGNANVWSGDKEPVCCGPSACLVGLSCCLDKCYDPKTQVCCQEKNNSNTCSKGYYGGPDCCGAFCDYRNDATTLCCSDTADGSHYEVGLGLSCCHGVGYSPLSQRCCVDGNGAGSTVPRDQSCPARGSSSSGR